MVQLCVSQLRKLLAGSDDAEIVTHGRSYELRLDPEAVDVARFERLVAEASAGANGGKGAAARAALALWRGAPLADLPGDDLAAAETRRLDDLRLAAIELAIEDNLEAGRHLEAIGRLQSLVAAHPLRESFHGLLMLALYRAGRQAEALHAYHAARAEIVEAIGPRGARPARRCAAYGTGRRRTAAGR